MSRPQSRVDPPTRPRVAPRTGTSPSHGPASGRDPGDVASGARFIFVGGPPRSGTTLLQNMLDSHPDIFGGPEFHHLQHIMDLWRKVERSVEKGWIRPFTDSDHLRRTVRDLVLAFLRPPLTRSGARWLSEKTPGNALVLGELFKLFPEARGVVVVRDPRAIVSSLLKVGRRHAEAGKRGPVFVRRLAAATRHAREHLESGLAAADAWPERVRVVRYENLVRNPARVTRGICDFLGAPWAQAMIEPASVPHAGETDIANRLWYTRDEFRRNPETSRIDKWMNELTPTQQVWATKACRPISALASLGYELNLHHLGAGERLRGELGGAALNVGQSSMMLARRAARSLVH